MYSIDRTSPVPIDSHSLMSNEIETEIESSTPELNLLLVKVHSGVIHFIIILNFY
jgi:hypothetical protein